MESMRRQQLDAVLAGPKGAVFAALCRTLAFRRWPIAPAEDVVQGRSYGYQTGSVRRTGRIVEVVRPVALTLKEVLHDPPCRVSLTMRWRIEPLASGCTVRLGASYRLNHAAILRRHHWDERLRLNFRNQFTFLAVNLSRIQNEAASGAARNAKRDLQQA
jgi:hypothetical protein